MRLIALLALPALAACSGGFSDALSYSDVKADRYPHGGATWKVFDKPAQNKMLVTASESAAFAAGASWGITTGEGGIDGRPTPYHAAAAAYVAPRGCEITGGRELIEFTFEFTYSC